MKIFLIIISSMSPLLAAASLLAGYIYRRNYAKQMQENWRLKRFPTIIYGLAIANFTLTYLFLLFVRIPYLLVIPALLTSIELASTFEFFMRLKTPSYTTDLVMIALMFVFLPVLYFMFKYANSFFASLVL